MSPTLLLIHLLLSALSVLLVARLLPGVRVEGYGSALAFALVMAVLNAIAWKIFWPLTVTFKVLTLGLGGLVINGLLFLLAGRIVPGVYVSGCFTAIFASFCVTAVNWLMRVLLGNWAP